MLYADSCSCNASDEDSTIKLVCIGAGIPPCECNEEHCEVSILMSMQNELCYDLTHTILFTVIVQQSKFCWQWYILW